MSLQQRLAEAAMVSGDPTTKVGCIITRNGLVIAEGCNRLPRGVQKTAERLLRPAKYDWIVHAEPVALMHALHRREDVSDAVMHLPCHPCCRCAGLIIESGIQQIQINDSYVPKRWRKSCEIAKEMFAEAGVHVIVCGRGESPWPKPKRHLGWVVCVIALTIATVLIGVIAGLT